jgi:hypothetical protein
LGKAVEGVMTEHAGSVYDPPPPFSLVLEAIWMEKGKRERAREERERKRKRELALSKNTRC